MEHAGQPVVEKIADRRYLEKYYRPHRENGGVRWYRKSEASYDADGDRVPLLDEQGQVKAEDVVVEPAVYGKYENSVSYGAHRVAERLSRMRDWARAQLKHVLGRPDSTEAEVKGAHWAVTKAGEQVGVHAAGVAIPQRYPPHQFVIEVLQPIGSHGSGAADGVVRVSPREGVTNKEGITEPIIVVVEAKGPHATLGHRKGLDDRHYQQGHRRYLESVILAMGKSGSLAYRQLSREMNDALEDGLLRYELVRATVNRGGSYSGYRHREFDISATKRGSNGKLSEGDSD
ncbi:hypothetical protein ACPXB3_22345 [Gordonia sp. DT219]|uniref:hypothetical protein n=1 Tax=Gordonia sp. DT219 TaxID=3416658 RepID=UPI003CEE64FE